jgi:hypothetical protein
MHGFVPSLLSGQRQKTFVPGEQITSPPSPASLALSAAASLALPLDDPELLAVPDDDEEDGAGSELLEHATSATKATTDANANGRITSAPRRRPAEP